jgi:excisionase family DNA binding protein
MLLTLSEVAKFLHCSKAHVSNVVAGRVHGCPPIPALRLGRRILILRTSLEAWIAANDRVAVNIPPKPVARISASPERGRRSA